jgi:hypothetical protein
MANTFSVTAVADRVSLDAQRKGLASFTITNTTDQPARGRGQVTVTPPAEAAWITVVGEASRPIPAGSTEQYPVQIAVAPTAPAGTYSFRLDAVNEANPDEDTTAGPTVTFEAPAAEAPVKRKFPWWIVILIAVVVVGAVIVVLLVSGGDDEGTLPAGNVIKNPDAEAGTAAANENDRVLPPEWRTVPGPEGFGQVAYGASGGFPDPAAAAAISGGKAFFAGGRNATTSEATQTIDLGSAAAKIDKGGVTATLRAALGGFADQGDRASVTAQFRGTAGPLGQPVTVGPVTAADRGNQNRLVAKEATATVPPKTRSVVVTISAVRDAGVYNDGLADNLSLTFAGGS